MFLTLKQINSSLKRLTFWRDCCFRVKVADFTPSCLFSSVVSTSDPIGHHSGVQFQKERLQLAQPTLLLLLLLLAEPPLLVHSCVFSLLFLFLIYPGHPGSTLLAGICSRIVGRKVHRYGGLVVVGEAGQQVLDHVWPLI